MPTTVTANVITDDPVVAAISELQAGAPATDKASVSATAGAATSNTIAGTVTSEALTTAAAADYVLTLTNSKVTATSVVVVSAANGTNTTEGLAVNRVQPAAGSVVIRVKNVNASALNGTIKINYAIVA